MNRPTLVRIAALAMIGTGCSSIVTPTDALSVDAATQGDASMSDDAAIDPLAAPPQCTSGTMWTRGYSGSSQMTPGQACIACHTSMGTGLVFSLAGTVFPTGHEPNNCNGANPASLGAIDVEVTDTLGHVIHMSPNQSGNFFSNSPLTPPYTARVVYQGRERRALTPQTSGDCNLCHAQSSMLGLPGRITLP